MGETAGLEIWPYISGFGRDEEKKKKKQSPFKMWVWVNLF